MAVIFRTDGAWGAGKSANLTPAEVDGNFYQLVLDIAAAAAAAGSPVGIANIVVVGSQMTVVLTDASELGPYTIPRAPYRPTVTENIATTTYDPVLADANCYKRMTHGDGATITIPAAATVDFPVDTELSFRQAGGVVVFEAAVGVTLNGIAGFLNQTAVAGAVATVKKVGADEWDLLGFLAEDIS